MTLTLDDIAKFEELGRQRDRALAQGYTLSNIPTGPEHDKYIEYKKWKQSVESLQSAGAVGNELTAGHLSSLSPMSPVAMLRSAIPTQDPNMMLDLLLRAVVQASSPQPHICPQAMPAHSLNSGACCRCFLAEHPRPSFPIGAHSLAHGLPAHPHGIETNSTNFPATNPRVTEVMSRTENEQAITEDDGACEDEADRESTQICLFLGKKWQQCIPADVCRDSTENWISEKLLRHSNDVIKPSQCAVAYRAPDGIRLESKGCVKIDCRLYLDGKTFPGVLFQVHASRSCAPDITLGVSWAQKHSAAVLLARRSANSKGRNAQRWPGNADSRPKHIRSQAIAGNRIMKVPIRDAQKSRG